MRKSVSCLEFRETQPLSPTTEMGKKGLARNMSSSSLKRLSSYDSSGRRSSTGSGLKYKRNISFGNKEIFDIPTRRSITLSEKHQMWYDHLDVNGFVGQELQRRKDLGMTSTNALVAEPVRIDEEVDEDRGGITF
eukprot:FR737187.1.p1 GENE.FR737187.1~~FR737187.1.p1  ORF type:complete len:156 (+),score=7.55 FR737187.1:66-470(+)